MSNIAECSVDDCTTAIRARGLCAKHYQRLLKHGDPNVNLGRPRSGNTGGLPRKAVVGYTRAHQRLYETHGHARSYACVQCGGPATDWALRIDAENIIEANGRRYSLDPMEYQPICHRDHLRVDACLRKGVVKEISSWTGSR